MTVPELRWKLLRMREVPTLDARMPLMERTMFDFCENIWLPPEETSGV